MVRVLTYLIGVLALGAGVAWLADRPGRVVMTWQGYEIQTSLMAMMLGLIVLTGILILIWTIYRWIVEGPRALSDYFRSRRQVRGYEALSRGMIAIGAGDPALAAAQARQARKLLAEEPLVGLLTAQSAQLSGDKTSARAAFESMLEDPQTALLGLHGLYVEAERQGDMAAAAGFADEAVKRAPALRWAAEAALAARVAEENWDGAIERLDRNHSNGLIDKSQNKRLKAVLLTAKALTLEEEDPETALAAAQEAVKLSPGLVPAAAAAGRLLAGDGRTGPASSLLEKAWRANPHPDIAAVYAHARSGDSVRDRLKRVKALAAKTPDNEEARVAVANAAIEALDWSEARKALEPLVEMRPDRRVCLLMAEIEEGEHGDKGRVREWFARALRAPRDPAWVADGHVSDAWAPVSPVTGRLDAYEWQVPEEDVAPPSAAVLEAAQHMASEDEAPLLIDVTARSAEAPAKPAPAPEPKPEPAKVKSADVPAEKPSETIEAKPAAREMETGGKAETPPQESPELAAASAFVRAPDDPGPVDDEEDGQRKWFGMFNNGDTRG
ncbi:MAG: heme biosynthesis HemY N-terminal domain-containing protein [Tepidamorphaceae bacterium]